MKFSKVENISDGNLTEENVCKSDLQLKRIDHENSEKLENNSRKEKVPVEEADNKNFDQNFEDNLIEKYEKQTHIYSQQINIPSASTMVNLNTLILDNNQEPFRNNNLQVKVNTISYNNESVSPIKNEESSDSERESNKEINDSIVVDSSRLFSNETIERLHEKREDNTILVNNNLHNDQIKNVEHILVESQEKENTKIIHNIHNIYDDQDFSSNSAKEKEIDDISNLNHVNTSKNEKIPSPKIKQKEKIYEVIYKDIPNKDDKLDINELSIENHEEIQENKISDNQINQQQKDKKFSNISIGENSGSNKNLSTINKNPITPTKNLDQSHFSSKVTNKYTPNPTHVDSDFLQKVEISLQQNDKDKEYLLEKEELSAIESSLTIDQRLLHQKWQIRKNAYKEVSDIISSSENDNEIFDTFSPWLKYFLSETNVIALVESLNTFYTFNKYAMEYRSKLMIDFFDELEKLLNHFKQNLNEVCHKLILLYLNSKKMFNSTFNEIIKKLNSTNLKLVNFIQKLILDLLNEKIHSQEGKNTIDKGDKNQNLSNQIALSAFSENYIKFLLEKSILYYSTSLSSKNIERKKIFAKLITEIYSIIEDHYDVIRKNVNVTNFKDLEKLFKSVKKRKDIHKRFIIYNETLDIIESGGGNNFSDQDEELTEVSSKNEVSERNFSGQNKILNKNEKNLQNQIVSSPSEACDIISIIPDDFYEIRYVNQFNKKKEILEKTNKILSNLQTIKDKNKDHREILSSLNYAIDDSNVLVHSEGIKCLNHLSRLLKSSINQSKLKLLLLSSFDKFKDKKSLVKIELYNLYYSIILNSCFTNGIDYFLNFILQFVQNQKNPVIKQSLLEYLKILFSDEEEEKEISGKFQSHNEEIKNIKNSIEDISYVNFSKLLADAMPNETQSNIKDLCTDLILIFKNKTTKRGRSDNKDIEEKFKKIIDTLPSYRKNIISKGSNAVGRSISNSRGVSTEISEREYKAGLKKIKSNINVRGTSSSKEVVRGNRFNTEKPDKDTTLNLQKKLNEKNNQQSENKERSSSKNKSNLLQFNKGKENKLNKSNEKNEKNLKEKENSSTLSKKDLLEKMMNKKNTTTDKKPKDEDSKNKNKILEKEPNNIKRVNKISDSFSTHSTNKNPIQSQHADGQQIKSQSPDEDSSFIHTNRSQTTTNISVLEKRMESAIEHIYSLNNQGLFEYTKKVIKDFLIFVKNVTSKKLNEDMESHFQVILKILSKIWERLRNAPDELIIQTLKVIIVAPCFIDLNEAEKNISFPANYQGKVFRHYLYPFMEQMRKSINNDEKVFYLYLDILNKFVNNETRGTTFLDNVNPRPTVIMFLSYFLNQENQENFSIEEMGIENLIFEIIEKSSFLSEYEKSQFYKILEMTSNNKSRLHDGNEEHQEYHEGENYQYEQTERDLQGSNNSDKLIDKSQTSQNNSIELNKQEKPNNLKSSIIENIKSDRVDHLDEDLSNILHQNTGNKMQNEEIILINNKVEPSSLNNKEFPQSQWKNKFIETENILQLHIEENEKLKERLNNIVIAKQNFISKDDKNISTLDAEKKPSDNSISHINASINEDIQEIKDKLKQKMRKLDMNIQRIEDKTKGKQETINNSNLKNEFLSNVSNKKTLLDDSISNDISILNNKKITGNNIIRNLQDFYEEENQSIQLNQPLSNLNNQNINCFSNPIKKNEEDAKSLILKIPSNLLDDNICEIALYVKLESIFQKSNVENKRIFTDELKIVLENNQLIKTSSFNCFLQLFEFLLNLLTHEIILNNDAGNRNNLNNKPNYNPSAMISLQEIIENTIKKKPMTEIFKVLIYLLRKYLPRDFNYMIDKLSVVYLKTISYLIKLCLDNKTKYNPEFNLELRCYDILHEINELFVTYPPSSLREGVPNLDLLDKIYRQLRILTDVSVNSDLAQAKLFFENSKKRSKTNYCQDYMQYLVSIINN
jgi:hypothetical protein